MAHPVKRDKLDYQDKLKKRYGYMPEIRKIAKFRNVPKSVYRARQTKSTMRQGERHCHRAVMAGQLTDQCVQRPISNCARCARIATRATASLLSRRRRPSCLGWNSKGFAFFTTHGWLQDWEHLVTRLRIHFSITQIR